MLIVKATKKKWLDCYHVKKSYSNMLLTVFGNLCPTNLINNDRSRYVSLHFYLFKVFGKMKKKKEKLNKKTFNFLNKKEDLKNVGEKKSHVLNLFLTYARIMKSNFYFYMIFKGNKEDFPSGCSVVDELIEPLKMPIYEQIDMEQAHGQFHSS